MKDLIQPHPNLSDAINAQLADAQLAGGVWVRQPQGAQVKDEPYLAVGKTLHVQTQNTRYTIVKTGEDTFTIQGHPRICPTPVPCRIHGATWGGSMIQLGRINRGGYLEFSVEGQTYLTTLVQEIEEQA